jgi:hypothetical protein
MSRPLPEKPNLEYLQKEAKELRRTMPQSRLADAQQALAKEYGFATWAKLKTHVEALALTPSLAFTAAVRNSDAARVRELLERHAELRARIDAPLENYGHGQHAMFAAVQRGDRATVDVLLAADADIRKRTEWAAGGFGVLDDCDPGMVEFLTTRGAQLGAHSAARLGLIAELTEMVRADPEVVHARGADGRTPLHFASTVEIAEFLLASGADIDARDRNYQSTPAQHMLRVEHWRHYPHDRQPVACYLVSRGCHTDILMAAALGDLDLVRRLLDADPACIAMSVSKEWFPNGTVYNSQLGAKRTPHAVARDFGHEGLPVASGTNARLAQVGVGMRLGRRICLSRTPRPASRSGGHSFRCGTAQTARCRPERQHQSRGPDAGSRVAGRHAGRDGRHAAALGGLQRQRRNGARDSALSSLVGIKIG